MSSHKKSHGSNFKTIIIILAVCVGVAMFRSEVKRGCIIGVNVVSLVYDTVTHGFGHLSKVAKVASK